MKTKGNTPKYGLIYHSTFIGRASAKNKGRISRYLANKCAIASRIDSFIEEPTSAYGEQLRDQVEERLRFYDSGETPRKNIDVMTAVAEKLRYLIYTWCIYEVIYLPKFVMLALHREAAGDDGEKKKKKKKKDKKREREAEDGDDVETEEKDKKKKKKKDKHRDD